MFIYALCFIFCWECFCGWSRWFLAWLPQTLFLLRTTRIDWLDLTFEIRWVETYQVGRFGVYLKVAFLAVWWLVCGPVSLFANETHFFLQNRLVWLSVNKDNVARPYVLLQHFFNLLVSHGCLDVGSLPGALFAKQLYNVVLHDHENAADLAQSDFGAQFTLVCLFTVSYFSLGNLLGHHLVVELQRAFVD